MAGVKRNLSEVWSKGNDFTCSLCMKKNKKKEADKFCADCNEFYCTTCVTVHDDIKVLQTHNILDKPRLKQEVRLSISSATVELCRKHRHKPVDMYCRIHDDVGCSTCMTQEHSDCKETLRMQNYVEKVGIPDANTIRTKLENVNKALGRLKKEIIIEKSELTTAKEVTLKSIHDLRRKINHRLDELENKICREAECRFQSLTAELESSLKELQTTANEIEHSLKNLQDPLCSTSQLFVCIKRAHEVAATAGEKISTLSEKVKLSTVCISFAENEKLSDLLNEIQELGYLNKTQKIPSNETQTGMPDDELEDSDQDTNQNSDRDTNQDHYKSLPSEDKNDDSDKDPSYDEQNVIEEFKGKKRYPIRVKSDRKICDIISACTLEDGSMLLADWNNQKLKWLSKTSYTVRDCFELPDRPRQVCSVGNNEAAVTCPGALLIKFVTVDGKISEAREITTEFGCYGLAYDDGKLYVSDKGPSVYVLTVSGMRMQQVKMDPSRTGPFTYVIIPAICCCNSKIYLADSEKGLMVLDKKGKLLVEFNAEELHGARDVCHYKNDEILVCGADTQNILEFSTDGKFLGQVLKSAGKCKTICWQGDKLFVGFAGNDEIAIYEMK